MMNKQSRLARRYLVEQSLHLGGLLAILLAALALLTILGSIFSSGFNGFFQSRILLNVHLSSELLALDEGFTEEDLYSANFNAVLLDSMLSVLSNPPSTQEGRRKLLRMLSSGATLTLREALQTRRAGLNTEISIELPLNSRLDQLNKGNLVRKLGTPTHGISEEELAFFDEFERQGRIHSRFNFNFFTSGDSRNPELAGIGSALVGSLFSLAVCLLLAFPVGVGAAIYLEEFSVKNRFTEVIEVSINNLAAVPSIIFGLLGLAVLINTFGMPRSTPLVGGAVLALMTLPTIIITCRASLKAVPDSIRQASLAMGATQGQTVFHHVLPLALPGTLTGTIIGLSQALGETAPLLLIGMVAFVVDIPSSPLDISAALPVQVYLWAESPERGFLEKTSAAIIVILFFLLCMNAIAVSLRHKLEKKW